MLNAVTGANSSVSLLKQSLDVSTRRAREIAHRVANVSTFQVSQTTPAPGDPNELAATPIDIETEMVSLADEQLKNEAATRLLQKVYQQIRTSVKG